jgi:predicted CopG family antitoxin
MKQTYTKMRSRINFRTIVMHQDTYDTLKTLGDVTESFDLVIRRLIETDKHMRRVEELEKKAAMGDSLAGRHPNATSEHMSKEWQKPQND